MISATDSHVLWALLRGQPRGRSHAERLQSFYAPQASRYDEFRERLLQGRRELVADLAPSRGARVIELGAGTGRNLDFFGDRLATFAHVDLVDLCPALLARARTRTAAMDNVTVVEADVTDWRPDEPADVVYFSYALTMIPDWRGAIDNAIAMLRPSGRLGVVDFYVSEAAGGPGRVRHGVLTRVFWPRWFGHDGVKLDPAHLAYLIDRLPDHRLYEERAPVPYMAGLQVPHYRFVGTKAV